MNAELRNTRNIICSNNIHLYFQVFPLCLADKGALEEIQRTEETDVGTGRTNTLNWRLLQKDVKPFLLIWEKIFRIERLIRNEKLWDKMCASSWHRQIVTKWFYYLREHSTISNKYAACLYLYSKYCCFPYIIGSALAWVFSFFLPSEINHIH